jgi:D-alanine--poly(phosphoribitol) ligase subunit 1
MKIQQLVQERFHSENLNIYDCFGQKIERSRLLKEYTSIRSYLSQFQGETIAIKIQKDYHYFLILLASLEVGVTYIPLKWDYPESRIEQIKEDSHFKVLVDEATLNVMLSFSQEMSPVRKIADTDPAYIIFTSGSTGRPKGVLIPRMALSNFFDWVDSYFPQVTKEDHLLQVTEFTFDISLLDVGFFLQKNVHLHFSNFENNIFKLAFEIENLKITCLNTVPNNLNMFLSETVVERTNYKTLQNLFIAGSRFSYGLYQKCIKYFEASVNVYNLYGPTECTVYSHAKKLVFNEVIDCSENNIAIGTSLTKLFSVIVLDDKVAAPHERGELYLGGVQLMLGYSNNPSQTQQAMIEFEGKKYYKSGDVAFKDEKGEYYIVGRVDDTIKYRGFRINLLDIDSYIHTIPYVQDAATIAIEDEDANTKTICFAILKEKKTVKELKTDLAKILLDFQIPEKIIFVDSFQTNSSGKVDRKALKQNFKNS